MAASNQVASVFSSVFTYSGNSDATLNTLTNVVNPDTTKNLSDLSVDNYPPAVDQRQTKPSATNQLIFMNQPMSWWLSNLNSGAVKYFPFSNHVNWTYSPSTDIVYHIDYEVSKLFIPDTSVSVMTDASNNKIFSFSRKLDFGRTDTRSI
jgi:hypothetical protein